LQDGKNQQWHEDLESLLWNYESLPDIHAETFWGKEGRDDIRHKVGMDDR
jgi:hypothetical protein